MNAVRSDFGNLENSKINLYTLQNANGMTVKISNYGATITSIQVPNKHGDVIEICCGYDSLEGYFSKEYITNAPYFGSTVGRYCSQIKDAKFTMNGIEHELVKNCGENNLHGGTKGFDKKIWQAEILKNNTASAIRMTLVSDEMEEGFPGNMSITVTFSLNDENELKVQYNAETDWDTPFSVTNHSYFNLSGFSSSIENHTVQIFTDKRQEWDASGAGTGTTLSLDSKPEDLRIAKTIKSVHEAMNDGFEHYYIFDLKGFNLEKVAEINCLESGLSMEISTSEPGMLFYTGKYTSDELKRESGDQFGKYRGFCCETHRYPNGPNIADAPKSILRAGETFDSTTIFKFKW